MRSILLNRIYMGILLTNRKTVGDNNHGPSQIIEIPIALIITDEKEWNIAQQSLSDNKSLHQTEGYR